MPRYLTPGRISLLVLAEIYVSGRVPSSTKLHVLSFLSSQVILSSKHDHFNPDTRPELADLSIDALSENFSQCNPKDLGSNVYDRFLIELWKLNDLDSLFRLFKQLAELCTTPTSTSPEQANQLKLSRASPLGQFVRRCCYEFERLQFADVQKLWLAFRSYRAVSYQRWAQLEPDAAETVRFLYDSPPGPFENIEQFSWEYTSTQDIDNLLTSSIQHLQKLGTRVPAAVKSQLEQWFTAQQDTNVLSLQHFMAFFEHWKAGQMSMALEALHQYFDYSMGSNRGTEHLRVYFQYAQLHQSVLYADFECWEESVNAMSECIATARENQDTGCLSFALSWLLHLRQVHPSDKTSSFESLAKLLGGSTEHDEIAFLKSKARETRQWALMSSTLLEEAKLELYAGGHTSKALEHILQSMFLNVQHDHRGLMPPATLFESAAFERLGQSRLSFRICQSLMLLHRFSAPLNDRVRAICRTAHMLVQMGRYDVAEQLLKKAEGYAQGVLKLQDRVAVSRYLLSLRRSIHGNQRPQAKNALRAVQTLKSAPEIEFESNSLEIACLVQAKEYEKALFVVNGAIEKLKQRRSADIAQRLQLLVLKSKIFIAADQPTKGFSIVMRAALTAERYCLMSVLTEAIAALSNILNALGEFEASRELVEAVLPHALSTGNVQVEAELFSSLADSCAGLAGRAQAGSNEQLPHLRLSVTLIERSREAYQKLGDVSATSLCLLKKVVLERALGETDAAALTDEMYARLLEDPDMVNRNGQHDERDLES